MGGAGVLPRPACRAAIWRRSIPCLLELEAVGLAAIGGATSPSLKDGDGAALLRRVVAALRPAVLLNATAFAVGADGQEIRWPRPTRPLLQVIQAGGGEAAGVPGRAGLGPRNLAMHVALPELDGRVLAGAVSFKSASERERADRSQPRPAPADARSGRPCGPARGGLGAACGPTRHRTPDRHRAGQLPDPRRQARQRGRPRHAGQLRCRAGGAARRRLRGGRHPGRRRRSGAGAGGGAHQRAGGTYGARGQGLPCRWHATAGCSPTLPAEVPQPDRGPAGASPGPTRSSWAIRSRWPLLPLGNVVIGLQPARGYHIDPAATYHAPGPRPAARLPRLLSVAAARVRRARGRASGQARQPGMAAGQGHRRCRPPACPRPCWARCRISTRSSSTTRAKAPRPSAAPGP